LNITQQYPAPGLPWSPYWGLTGAWLERSFWEMLTNVGFSSVETAGYAPNQRVQDKNRIVATIRAIK
jgi:hypothetical protein